MKKTYKSKITLTFDNAELKAAMITFFKQYQRELPLFLKDALTALGISSDPKMVIHDNEINLTKVNQDKGRVFIWDSTEENITLVPYLLVANDERYLYYENGALIVYFKRAGSDADMQAGMFPDFSMAFKGLKDVQDPAVLAAEVEEKAIIPAAEAAEMEVIK